MTNIFTTSYNALGWGLLWRYCYGNINERAIYFGGGVEGVCAEERKEKGQRFVISVGVWSKRFRGFIHNLVAF